MNKILLTRMYNSGTLPAVQRSAKLIRNEFLDYFKKDLGHAFIRSSPVISFNDHTVAFVNAGMNQFKGVFLDYYDPPATKVTNAQKCIRISGKHNDLDIVGNDGYHHTFFEMLGNWSFGSYFKEEACRYAWNLLTEHYGINKEFLYVTYFGGNEKLGLAPDLECKDIWLNIGVNKDKVLPFGLQENFWEMGTSGPCGPCTEIHVDHTKQLRNRSTEINKGLADLTELWNIVFIQYERVADNTMVPLSKHYVDTGMGFERLVALIQGKQSNYDTDLFLPLFETIQKYTKAPPYKGEFDNGTNELDREYRKLADHSRMITVALADGIVPEERYKLRRIIRKTFDISEKVFKKKGVLLELSYAVVESLGNTYPELENNLKKVQKIIKFEEELYERLQHSSAKKWKQIIKTYPQLKSVTQWMAPGLEEGYKYLQNAIIDLKSSKIVPGYVSFKLYDAYGLNTETIAELAKIESLHFDMEDFQNELENQRKRSRVDREKSSMTILKKSLELLEKNNIPKTDDNFKYKYIRNGNNYEFPEIKSNIQALVVNDNVIFNKENENNTSSDLCSIIDEAKNDEIGIILDKTVCYSLEGGQKSDKGVISTEHLNFNINSVNKVNGYVIHYGKFLQDNLKECIEQLKIANNCIVSLKSEFRIGAMQHHTATHLLNASVQQIMQAVYMRNSVVIPNNLNCQFNSFGEKPSFEQLKEIENLINDVINANVPVATKVLNALELLAEDSVTLTQGEIYPYKGIRVVEIDHCNLKSKEACYGTHVFKTGDLEYFCICNYFSKGAANFNLEAIVGSHAIAAKMAGEKVKHKLFDLEKKLEAGEISHKTFKSVSKEIENEIKCTKEVQIPYLIIQECLTKLKNLNEVDVKMKEAKKKLKSSRK